MSEALMIVFTAVIAVATVVYARLTKRLVELNRNLVTLQTQPALALYLQIRPSGIMVDAILENTGSGAAHDLRAEFVERPEWFEKTQFAGLRWLTHGLSYLAPRAQVRTMFAVATGSFLEEVGDPVRLRITYEDALRERMQQEFVLDLKELEGFSITSKLPIEKISESLEKIAKALTRGHPSAVGMPFIVAMSHAEYEEWELSVHEELEKARQRRNQSQDAGAEAVQEDDER